MRLARCHNLDGAADKTRLAGIESSVYIDLEVTRRVVKAGHAMYCVKLTFRVRHGGVGSE